jgi:hypothetical protein
VRSCRGRKVDASAPVAGLVAAEALGDRGREGRGDDPEKGPISIAELAFGFFGLADEVVAEDDGFGFAVADFVDRDGIAKGFDQAGGFDHPTEESHRGGECRAIGFKVDIDVADFAGDGVFGFDGAKVVKEFAHPIFGEAVVQGSGHGGSRTFESSITIER